MTKDMVDLKGTLILGSETNNCFPRAEMHLNKCGEPANAGCGIKVA